MIRSVIIIALTMLLAVFANGQSWEDSLLLGQKYYQEKEYQKAYQTLLEAQKLAPNGIDLSQDIGNAAYRNADFEMSEKAFQAAAANEKDNNRLAQYWHNVGNSQMKTKDYQAAIESYKQSLRKNPNNDKTRYNLAEAQRRLKIQKEQQQKQQQEKNQHEAQEGDNQQDSKKNQHETDQDQQQNQDQNQQGESGNKDTDATTEPKLTDRKTERMLEELLKQEMETKKKVQGIESDKNQKQVKSGKRW